MDFVSEQESDLVREFPSSDSSSLSPKPPEPLEALMLDHWLQEKSSSPKPHAPKSSAVEGAYDAKRQGPARRAFLAQILK